MVSMSYGCIDQEPMDCRLFCKKCGARLPVEPTDGAKIIR